MHHGQVSREDLRSVRSQRRVHPGRVGGDSSAGRPPLVSLLVVRPSLIAR